MKFTCVLISFLFTAAATAQEAEPQPARDYAAGARLGRANAVTSLGFEFSGLRDDGDSWAATLVSGSSSSQAFGKDFDDADRTMRGSLFLAQYRKFFGGSLFVSGGIGTRTVGYVAEYKTFGGGSARYEGEASSVVASTSVGNIWRWPNGFYMGADWFGLTVPVDGSYKATGSSQQPFDDAADKEKFKAMKDLAENTSKATMNFALMLNIGGEF